MTKKELRYHTLYLDIASRIADMSHCNRLKVGSVLVKNDNIISFGWNGQPSGFDNTCEDCNNKTLDTVIHAEDNAIRKVTRDGIDVSDSILYITHAPCLKCSNLIVDNNISSVVYKSRYRSEDGVKNLENNGIHVKQITGINNE